MTSTRSTLTSQPSVDMIASLSKLSKTLSSLGFDLPRKHDDNTISAFAELELMAKEFDGWTHSGVKHGVTLSYKDFEDSNIRAFRGVCSFGKSVTVEAVKDFLVSPDHRKSIDEYLLEHTQCDYVQYDDHMCASIDRCLYKKVLGVSGREFVVASFQSMSTDKSKSVLVSYSIDDDRFPVLKHHIRGQVIVGGYVIEAIEDDEVIVTTLNRIDLCGKIPRFIMNQFQKSQPASQLTRVRTLLFEHLERQKKHSQ